MIIEKIEAEYSKSINTANYGLPEEWIKVNKKFHATLESNDNTIEACKTLSDAVKQEVLEECNELVNRMQQVANGQQAQNNQGNAQAKNTVNGQQVATGGQNQQNNTAQNEPNQL